MNQKPQTVDVVIMAGGTGGHIFPGLAIAQRLKEQGMSVAWLGAHGLETKLVPNKGIDLYSLSIKGLRGNGIKGWLLLPYKLSKAVAEAKRILKTLQPKCVIGFGGFASGPGGIAAKFLGIPVIIHEQNAVPGMTNRLLAKVSDKVLTGFPLPEWGNSQYVGNPVRDELFHLPTPAERFSQPSDEFHVLIIGGSQGSRFINTIIPPVIAKSTSKIQVWHQTGEKLFEESSQSWSQVNHQPYRLAPFIENMAEAYEWADIILCRAGALTLAELTAVGLGSVLIPLPTAVDDHQRKNAEFLVNSDAAYCINERSYDHDALVQILNDLTLERCLKMAENARNNAKPNAVDEIVETIVSAFGR